jgi:hypothetical protein
MLARTALSVVGSVSGKISGHLKASSDGWTAIFAPDAPFAAGETIDVTVSGSGLPGTRFSFLISPLQGLPNPYDVMPELRPERVTRLSKHATTDTIPDDFPPMQIDVYDSTALGEGYLFLAVASEYEGVGYYLMMLNNDGTPFFARALENDYAYDFKLQPNGMLSYAHFFEHHSYTGGGNVVHKILDNSFALVDSVTMGNGYVAEAHDFQMLPNGHYLLFGYYLTPVDMSQIVAGGQPDALVSGGVLQELDADKNVVFQWRTWDYFDFETWSYNRRFATRSIVSAFHLNTVNLDDDGHIFLATPTVVFKINRQTGDIIWTLGGSLNEFSFVGVDSTDGVGMVTGHMFHRLPSGNVLVHDNGNRQGTVSSRANEFALDEESRTAELVWTYVPDTIIAGWHRGSAQRLPNGNTLIGWGGSSGLPSPAVTEVNAAGEKLYELSFVPPDIESYRAFRFPFTGGAHSAQVVIIEVVPGNTYDFSDTGGNTGVAVTLNSINSFGYNELAVTRYDFAPAAPRFFGKTPRVQPARMVLDNFAIDAIDADVRFAVDSWNIRDPENTLVYHREFEGSGLFLPLPTTYNPVKGEIVAETTQFGEFILAKPDFSTIVYTPWPDLPADRDSVNQEIPVAIRWSPVGYSTSFDLQVATDSLFASLVADVASTKDAFHILDAVDPGQLYYWRVRATNDAGTSEWSEVRTFSTTAPFISVSSPGGGEEWQRGLDHYIRWIDNVEEDVQIDLYRDGTLFAPIAATASDGAYLWEVDPMLEKGPGYSIRVISTSDDGLFDETVGFSIIDTTATVIDDADVDFDTYGLRGNYPNPFSRTTTILFQLPERSNVNLSIFDVLGRHVATLIDAVLNTGAHAVSWDGTSSGGDEVASGVYVLRMDAGGFAKSRQVVLLR